LLTDHLEHCRKTLLMRASTAVETVAFSE